MIKPTLLLLVALCSVNAFAPAQNGRSATTLNIFGKAKASAGKSSLPSFDRETEEWVAAASDDGEYPYDAVGSLLRHGPAPYIKRTTNPKGYEQAVLEYMAKAGADRAEATGNMDAKLNNAMDWAYQKSAEANGAAKVDYTVLKKKDAILTVIWALFVSPLVVYTVVQTVSQI
mmetsp:Transcript_24121/g.33706  ORF Transcript_24121/g.33706 Transcript_24121/m.33706 type:complete len:173 (+) Transcript_24121:20-538(+)